MATSLGLKRLWALIRPYWASEERGRAKALLAVIIALNLGEVYINVRLNAWNNDFYNSLQNVDKTAFFAALLRFSYLAFSFILVAVYKTYLNQMLRINWRRWLTRHYVADWLGKQNYYRMQLSGNPADNPDQRIAEDIEQFIQLTLGLSLGLLSSVVTLCSFLFILWALSGPLAFTFGGVSVTIPGYMLWAALVYAIIGTWLTMRIGRPLIGLNFAQQKREADFRFSLVRLRENTESVAFYRGEAAENMRFGVRLAAVVDNFWAIMKRQKKLSWFTAGYQQIAIIFPFVVAAPRFFAGQIQLGGLMQTASAFGQVQGALSYIIDSYSSIATWRACIDRLSGFNQSLRQAEAQAPVIAARGGENAVIARHLTLCLPDGRVLLKGIELAVRPGDTLLITGPSGTGKSTLLRALAGLWPFVEGELALPERTHMFFVPQKPYLPLGTLSQALFYPSHEGGDARAQEVLGLCGLSHVAARRDEAAPWPQMLSLGEQQRLAFARILLAAPAFIFLDEATSALDEAAEAQLYALLRERLPDAAIISVGHRDSLRRFHTQELALAPEP